MTILIADLLFQELLISRDFQAQPSLEFKEIMQKWINKYK